MRRWQGRPPGALTPEQMDRMNIGRRFWTANLDDLDTETPIGKASKRYVENLDMFRKNGHGLWLYGANGTGKTWAAAAILKECARRGFSCYCVLADVLKVAYIDGQRFDPQQTVVQRVEAVDILLVEDLGKEYSGKGSGWAELCFENMFRKRSRDLGVTFVTTNMSTKEFAARYADSALSLASECMTTVNVKGGDRRSSKDMTQLLTGQA